MSIFKQTEPSLESQVVLPSQENTHTSTPEKLGALGVMQDARLKPAFARYRFAASVAN
jgi:hypothetical protein